MSTGWRPGYGPPSARTTNRGSGPPARPQVRGPPWTPDWPRSQRPRTSLPAPRRAPTGSPAHRRSTDCGGGDMTKPALLAVDDDGPVLSAVERDLRAQYGERYQIYTASSGEQALDLLRRLRLREDPVALLLV